MRHLSVVTTHRADPDPVAYVPVRLLLAASGRCSCQECCREAVSAHQQPVRPSQLNHNVPERGLHGLS
jgi:hypothetical protein